MLLGRGDSWQAILENLVEDPARLLVVCGIVNTYTSKSYEWLKRRGVGGIGEQDDRNPVIDVADIEYELEEIEFFAVLLDEDSQGRLMVATVLEGVEKVVEGGDGNEVDVEFL